MLAADAVVVADARMLGTGRPAITYGLRGGLAFELEVFGPRKDLHAGRFGGMVHNPRQALCQIVAALHDRQGRVARPHFYDRGRLCRSAGYDRPSSYRTRISLDATAGAPVVVG